MCVPGACVLRSVPLDTLQFFAGHRVSRVSREPVPTFPGVVVIGSFAEEEAAAEIIVAEIDE